MIEIEEYNPISESEIDDIVFKINLEHDCLISVVIFGRREIEEGPLGESPLYRVIEREAGVSLILTQRGRRKEVGADPVPAEAG